MLFVELGKVIKPPPPPGFEGGRGKGPGIGEGSSVRPQMRSNATPLVVGRETVDERRSEGVKGTV
jgi:hypothetical protein